MHNRISREMSDVYRQSMQAGSDFHNSRWEGLVNEKHAECRCPSPLKARRYNGGWVCALCGLLIGGHR